MTKLSNDFKMIEAIIENKLIQYLGFEDFDEKVSRLIHMTGRCKEKRLNVKK